MARSIAIDANMLLVYVVGNRHPEYLGVKRRLKEYMPEDYRTLCDILSRFDRIILTPNVVTECSDLLGDSHEFNDAKHVLRELVCSVQYVDESYVPSSIATTMKQYMFLGVADCTMLSLVDSDTVLLTADSQLAREAQAINPSCINFNHCRNYRS